MQETDQELRFGNIKKLAWKFAIPSIISMIVLTLYNIVDRIFIGQIPEVGDIAMTGVGITIPMVGISFGIAMLVGVGSAALISIKLGEQKKDEANRVFNNGFEMIAIFSLLVMAVGWLIMKPVLRALGADDVTMPYAFNYMVFLNGGIFFSNMTFFLVTSVRSIGHPRIATICNVVGTLVNIALDPLFIFVFDMGIAGAAIATVISQFVSFALAFGFFIYKRDSLVLKIKKPNFKIDKQIALRIAQIGFAPFAMQIANSLLIMLANNVLKEYGGNLAIAAITIMFSLQNLVILPLVGYMQGQQPIIGFNYGAKAYLRVRQTLYYALKVVITFGVIGIILVELFPTILVRLFATEQELIDITVSGLRIYLASIGLLGVRFVAGNYCQYTGRAGMSTFLNIASPTFYALLLFILPPIMGVQGVWWGSFIADSLSILAAVIVFIRAMKKLPKHDEDFTKQNEIEGEKSNVVALQPEAELIDESVSI